MPWWCWIVGGLVLLAMELAAPGGFFLFFFGLSGLIIGLLAYASLIVQDAVQWGLFCGLSIVLILLFRRKLISCFPVKDGKADTDSMVGEKVKAIESIAPGAVGKAEFRGTGWQVKNIGSSRIDSGALAEIVAVDGITLSVKSA